MLAFMPRGTKAPASTSRDRAILAVLNHAKDRLDLNQDVLAAAVGISQSQVSRVLKGERPMTVPELLMLCEALGMSLEDLARRAGEA